MQKYKISKDYFFEDKNLRYFNFKIQKREEIKNKLIESSEFRQTDSELSKLMVSWFTAYSQEITRVAESKPLHELLDFGFSTIQNLFINNPVLDEFQVRGLFINWWTENKYELKTIKESGWKQSLVSKFYFENGEKIADKKLINCFFKGKYAENIKEIASLEEYEGKLRAEITEIFQSSEAENDEESDEPIDKLLKKEIRQIAQEIEKANKITSLAYTQSLQKELYKKENLLEEIISKKKNVKEIHEKLRVTNEHLFKNIQETIQHTNEENAEIMVKRRFEESALEILNNYLASEKSLIISYFENLWDKYGLNVRSLETESKTLGNRLTEHLRQLGYEDELSEPAVNQYLKGEIIDLGNKKFTKLITKGTTPTTYGYNFVESGINFVKVESISEDGRFLEGQFQHIDEKTYKFLKRSQLEQGDILFSIAGAIGRCAVVPKEILPANTNQALAILRLVDKNNAQFLKYMLQSQVVQREANRMNVQLAQANLSLESVSKLKITLPDSLEREKIVNVLDCISSKIELERFFIDKLKKIKAGLMEDLLNGKRQVRT